ncbi:host attachment protein [Egbenema bharatensis]|uniref:host attachment protein n=1 Tax=Egbenema bharatensis TaxID=3463334 RepID=UPI003A8C777E
MQRYIVAVVNSAKAKLFVLEPIEFPVDEPSPKLVAIDELHNANQTLHGEDLWSSTKPGRNRGVAGQAHGYDDHRDKHRVEFERRFAQEIVNRLVQIRQSTQPHQLILVAEPHILGIMRGALSANLPKNLKINELAKDLCQLKAHELQDYLEAKGLIAT